MGEKRAKRSKRARREARRERNFRRAYGSEARVEAIQRRRCVVPGCDWRMGCQASHVKSKGAGGGPRDTVPMCWRHHHEQHQIGILTFERRHGIDLAALACKIHAEIDRELR